MKSLNSKTKKKKNDSKHGNSSQFVLKDPPVFQNNEGKFILDIFILKEEIYDLNFESNLTHYLFLRVMFLPPNVPLCLLSSKLLKL